jgi:hypothetical protein
MGMPPSDDSQLPQPPMQQQPMPAQGDPSGSHPQYMKVLKDLREARSFIEYGPGVQTSWDPKPTVLEINAAIQTIHDAGFEQGIKPKTAYHVDKALDYSSRLRKAVELLQRSQKDCQKDPDTGFGNGLQGQVLAHIGQALGLAQQGSAANP